MEKKKILFLPWKMLKSADKDVLSFAEGTLEVWAFVPKEGEVLGLLTNKATAKSHGTMRKYLLSEMLLHAGKPTPGLCGLLPCSDAIEVVIEDWAQTGQPALTDWRGMRRCVQTKIQLYSGVRAVRIRTVIPQFGFLLGSTVPDWTEGVLHLSATHTHTVTSLLQEPNFTVTIVQI